MKRFSFFLFAIVTAGIIGLPGPTSGNADEQSAPYVTDIPRGYRDWKWISSAHEEGNLHSLGAILGNDLAINAYREGKLPFPDGTIIAALHYRHVPSDENNKVFGQAQSFVPGTPRTFSSWSRTRPNTPQPAAGGLDISAQTANQAMWRL